LKRNRGADFFSDYSGLAAESFPRPKPLKLFPKSLEKSASDAETAAMQSYCFSVIFLSVRS
jgi:hypothetical protein